MSVIPTHCTTRRGNKVSQSRLPVSLRHCPGWPIATTCGHHWWDWGTSTRLAQAADSLHSVVLHHGDQLSTDQKRVLRPPSAHQSSFPDTPPQRLRSRGRCQRSCQSSSSISRACCSSSNASAQETTPPTVRLSSLSPLAPPP